MEIIHGTSSTILMRLATSGAGEDATIKLNRIELMDRHNQIG